MHSCPLACMHAHPMPKQRLRTERHPCPCASAPAVSAAPAECAAGFGVLYTTASHDDHAPYTCEDCSLLTDAAGNPTPGVPLRERSGVYQVYVNGAWTLSLTKPTTKPPKRAGRPPYYEGQCVPCPAPSTPDATLTKCGELTPLAERIGAAGIVAAVARSCRVSKAPIEPGLQDAAVCSAFASNQLTSPPHRGQGGLLFLNLSTVIKLHVVSSLVCTPKPIAARSKHCV